MTDIEKRKRLFRVSRYQQKYLRNVSLAGFHEEGF